MRFQRQLLIALATTVVAACAKDVKGVSNVGELGNAKLVKNAMAMFAAVQHLSLAEICSWLKKGGLTEDTVTALPLEREECTLNRRDALCADEPVSCRDLRTLFEHVAQHGAQVVQIEQVDAASLQDATIGGYPAVIYRSPAGPWPSRQALISSRARDRSGAPKRSVIVVFTNPSGVPGPR